MREADVKCMPSTSVSLARNLLFLSLEKCRRERGSDRKGGSEENKIRQQLAVAFKTKRSTAQRAASCSSTSKQRTTDRSSKVDLPPYN